MPTLLDLVLLHVGQAIGLHVQLLLEDFVFFQDQVGLSFDLLADEIEIAEESEEDCSELTCRTVARLPCPRWTNGRGDRGARRFRWLSISPGRKLRSAASADEQDGRGSLSRTRCIVLLAGFGLIRPFRTPSLRNATVEAREICD